MKLPESTLVEFSKIVEVAATKVLEGLHHAERGGRGVEFHSTSSYSAGEDTRFIDWKRYASSDRLVVNRHQREERSGWAVWLDSSSSMNYGNKSQASRLWAAAILFLAQAWGDRWFLFPQFEFSLEEAFRALSHSSNLFEDADGALRTRASSTDRLIIVSDFFWEPEVLRSRIETAQSLYRSVHLIQFLDPREVEFNFKDVTEFEDLESPSRLILDAPSIRKSYQRALEELQKTLNAWAKDEVSSMLCLSEGEALEMQLLKFFESL